MPEINIKTLSPIHIGNGKELNANSEYLYFGGDEPLLTVIDEKKVLNIIGNENIDKWVNIINKNESLKEYLLKRKPDLKPPDVEQRSMLVYGSYISNFKTLKEQLYDGRQISYIPGSSIKGAIRTAVLSHFALKNKFLASNSLKNHKGHYDSQVLAKILFGENPNLDIFRFLQIGDAFFNYETIALKAQILNMYYNDWHFKRESSHLVECIGEDVETNFKIKINSPLLKLNNTEKDISFLEMAKLFEIINQHTLNLLNAEKEFWNNYETINESCFEYYIEKLNKLINIAENCEKTEAVLRIGFGSGWDFITGRWAKDEKIMDDNEYFKFLNSVRYKKYDRNTPFPKTRKMDEDGDILGFVKLKY